MQHLLAFAGVQRPQNPNLFTEALFFSPYPSTADSWIDENSGGVLCLLASEPKQYALTSSSDSTLYTVESRPNYLRGRSPNDFSQARAARASPKTRGPDRRCTIVLNGLLTQCSSVSINSWTILQRTLATPGSRAQPHPYANKPNSESSDGVRMRFAARSPCSMAADLQEFYRFSRSILLRAEPILNQGH